MEAKAGLDVQSPLGSEEGLQNAEIGKISTLGARFRILLLDSMLWSLMGCFVDWDIGEVTKDGGWDVSGTLS